jgi:uncharacterized membrane protein YgdD (TMEM256/DUF423 family)
VDRAFLALGCAFAFLAVAAGAFGTHALRARLTPERLATFETAVRYQLWHALALFAVVFLDGIRPLRASGWFTYAPLSALHPFSLPIALVGWLFVVGIVLFSGSLYALALTGERRWGAVTPFGGLCLLGGWVALLVAVLTS